MKNITIAGASGYIGRNLLRHIPESYSVKALSRKNKVSEHDHLTWAAVDLFSFQSTSNALINTDIAIYLVHSMLPSTRLFQGSFHDTDLMLADNFAKACKDNGVKQIIYLSGIVPHGELSKHLESRKEVEDVFISSGIPCTILRAGLVVGNGGSSFEILKNLAINLPAMLLPEWTRSKTQVIYLDDMISILTLSINAPKYFNQTLNITNGENLKYDDLIRYTAEHVGKKTILIPVPINYTSFSKLWVTIFGQSNYQLVSPLVDSLLCDFSKIYPDDLVKDNIKYTSYKEMLKKIDIKKVKKTKAPNKINKKNNVRSIQRLATDIKLSAHEIADEYLRWLPSAIPFMVKVKKEKDFIIFYLLGLLPLLKLQYIPDTKMKDRAKFHVIGGLLTKTKNTGWLEFRTVANSKYLLASINEFIPSLPWYLYKHTQAPVHKYVMNKFGKYLASKAIRDNPTPFDA